MSETPAPVRLLSPADLADKLRVSRTTAWAMRRRPGFPRPVDLGERVTRYVESEVDAWIAAQRRHDAPRPTNGAAPDRETADGAASL